MMQKDYHIAGRGHEIYYILIGHDEENRIYKNETVLLFSKWTQIKTDAINV